MKTAAKRQRPKAGDIFAVPLNDGTHALGQVLGAEPDALNSLACAFYDLRVPDPASAPLPGSLPQDKLIAILLITPDGTTRTTLTASCSARRSNPRTSF